MFNSLADEHTQVNATERYLRWAGVVVISFVLFGGLYMCVRFLE
jgi:hypothetical protein